MPNTFYQDFDFEELPDSGREPTPDHRGRFRVDRDRVLFSDYFRHLQFKTQVFQSGEEDYYRTRLTHSIEVASVCRSVCDALREQVHSPLGDDFYISPDLVEGLGFAHDLGHPPYGHIGERMLNEKMHSYGGFEGNAQTIRIVSSLIFERHGKRIGMRPTRAFIDGLAKYKHLHCELVEGKPGAPDYKPPYNHFLYDEQRELRNFIFGKVPSCASEVEELAGLRSVECQIMDWSDDAVYSLHDIEDGIRNGLISEPSLTRWAEGNSLNSHEADRIQKIIKAIRGGRVGAILRDTLGKFIAACHLVPVENVLSSLSNRYAFELVVESERASECALYKRIAFDLLFKSTQIQQLEFKGQHVLGCIFDALQEHYLDRPEGGLLLMPEAYSLAVISESEPAKKRRLLCDFMADMTDLAAPRFYQSLFDPS